MVRLYPLSLLLSFSIPAFAQQPDTLASHRVRTTLTQPDSISRSIKDAVTVTSRPLTPYLPLQEQLRQVAGVQASPYSGAPGAQVAVRIRGAASLSGNAHPLYVVDGVPVFQNMGEKELGRSSSAVEAARPYGLNPLLNLPNEDIESVSVLRGALATARYGGQGQNGVISIQTKLGRRGQPMRVSYSGYGGVQRVRRRYNLLTAHEYAEWQNEVASRIQEPQPFSAAQIATLGQGTDWQQEVLRTAALQEHHLGLTGSRNTTRYYVGADYLHQSGIVENSQLRRYALRANVEQQLTPRLSATARVAANQADARLPDELLALNMVTAEPTVQPRTATGELNNSGNLFNNPLRQALLQTREPRQRQLLSQVELRQSIGQFLTASLLNHWEFNYLHRFSIDPSSGPTPFYESYQQTDSRRFRQQSYRAALDFRRTLAERHALTAQLGAAWQVQNFRTLSETKLLGATTPVGSASSRGTAENRTTLASFSGEVGYSYDERYEMQASLRRDGSSFLAAEQRWQWSPAAQFTWHAGQESFLRASSTISHLNVWVGQGQTSNAGSFFGQSLYTTFLPNSSGGSTVFYTPLLETTVQREAGLSAGFWQDKVVVEASAYQRRTTLEAATGLTNFTDTQLQARGAELTLTGWWLRQPQWSASTILSFAAQQNRYAGQVPWAGNAVQLTTDGSALATFRGLRYLGTTPDGLPRYEEVNGDGTTNFLDYQNLGSGLPTHLLSVTQQLSYHRFSLQIQADGAFGHQLYNTAGVLLDNPTTFGSNGSTLIRQRWTASSPSPTVPAVGNEVQRNSSYYLQSGNHLRLSTVTCGYQVWEKDARNISVWVGGQNLLGFTKYRGFDPGISSGGAAATQAGLDASAYPTARTILLGLRATL